jgi:hypothetical protein
VEESRPRAAMQAEKGEGEGFMGGLFVLAVAKEKTG